MRVLHIIKSLGRGGAEMLLQETLPKHNSSTFQFHYIYFLPWKNQMVEGIERGGGKVVNIAANNNITIMLSANKIIRYIKKNNINIVHCHLPWAGFVGRYVHMLTGIPVLYTEHNKQERYHTITRLLNRFTFNKQTAVIAVSNDVAESIQKNIRPSIPVHTILNGVNTEYFVRDILAGRKLKQSLHIADDKIVIGTIAVFRFQKRLKEWILILKRITDKYSNVVGCMVGDGILNNEIRDFVAAQNMEDKILMPGLQTNVLPWMSMMDIYLMTSQFEGLPIALLEAMSMSCAIVTTDAGGIKEVIRNDVDGLLCSVDDWSLLEDKLALLLNNPSSIPSWGVMARQRVISKFSISNMVEQTEILYKQYGDAVS